MRQKNKYLLPVAVCVIMMFVLIFAAVILTGGRETYEFTKRDTAVFISFFVLLFTDMILMVVFLTKFTREKTHQFRNGEVEVKPVISNVLKHRAIIIVVCSVILAFSFVIVGIFIGKGIPENEKHLFEIIAAVCFILFGLMFPANILVSKAVEKYIRNRDVGYWSEYFYSHREVAENEFNKLLKLLRFIRGITDCYSVMLVFMGIIFAICMGISLITDGGTLEMFLSALMVFSGLSRIRFPVDKEFLKADEYVEEADYPELYKLVREVAKDSDCDVREIKIALLTGFDAGIGKFGDIYSVQLGVLLLEVLSEDEIRHVLLHEFAHMLKPKKKIYKETLHMAWLSGGGNQTFLSWLTNVLYNWSDIAYAFNYNIFMYANTVMIEAEADKAMLKYGTPQIAASSLLKIYYYNMYQWESESYDRESYYKEEVPKERVLSDIIGEYTSSLNSRKNDWDYYAQNEIQSRSSTHPIVRKRLETLGVTGYNIVNNSKSKGLKTECEKAFEYVEEILYNIRKENYDNEREEYYIKPKELVEKWIDDGRPIIAEQYADIVNALGMLGRKKEAEEICDKAMESLSLTAAIHAHFVKGSILLSRFDSSGISHLYHAIENNSNYIDEGIEKIGEFCCITGRKEDLEEYRRRAVEFEKEKREKYSHVGELNVKDDIVAEQLPKELHNNIIEYIASIDTGIIDKVFIVRKTISETFFTSAVIVRFNEQVDEDVIDDLMHQMFRFLDTFADWQFSLFDYRDVKKLKIESIEGSCVYPKNK